MTIKQRAGQWLFAHLPVTRFLFDQLRAEANALLAWLERTSSPRARQRLRRLEAQSRLRVNVACGPQIEPGFVNIDLYPAGSDVVRFDCRRRLPLSDASAEAIKVEHYFEHLEPREEAPAFLHDCLRALQPGGVLRVIVPDVERFVRAYCCGERQAFAELGVDEWPSDLPTRMDLLNHVFHQWHEHRWGYDFEALADRLSTAGFVDIERRGFGQSRLADLARADRPVHAPYSL